MKNILKGIKEMAMLGGLFLLLALPFILVKGAISYITGPRTELIEYEADCDRLGKLRTELYKLRSAGVYTDDPRMKEIAEEIYKIESKWQATP